MKNLIGKRYGKLTVIEDTKKRPNRCVLWLCRCDCGSDVFLTTGILTRQKSCGAGKCKTGRHMMSGTKIYRAWTHMRHRCMNPLDTNYKNYGARGITICDDWLDFDHFYMDMGDPPSAYAQIDRIDNEKGYFKDNCRWATSAQQSRNRRSNTSFTINGETKILKDWAIHFGLNYQTVHGRIMRYGWTLERALELQK